MQLIVDSPQVGRSEILLLIRSILLNNFVQLLVVLLRLLLHLHLLLQMLYLYVVVMYYAFDLLRVLARPASRHQIRSLKALIRVGVYHRPVDRAKHLRRLGLRSRLV